MGHRRSLLVAAGNCRVQRGKGLRQVRKEAGDLLLEILGAAVEFPPLLLALHLAGPPAELGRRTLHALDFGQHLRLQVVTVNHGSAPPACGAGSSGRLPGGGTAARTARAPTGGWPPPTKGRSRRRTRAAAPALR